MGAPSADRMELDRPREPRPLPRRRRPGFDPLMDLLAQGITQVRNAAARWPYGPWPFVVVAALGPLLWGRPYGDLLFGQDSTRLFQPFSFNDSPFIPYSYLYSSSFPVPDFTPYFYIDGTLRLVDDIGSPPWFSQRLVLGLFAGLAAGGVVLLIRAIDSARQPPARSSGLAAGLVALVYVYNPFTLSVSFWHVEGWTLFLAFLPWVVTLAVRTSMGPRPPWRFAAVVTLVGIYLAPGAISSFAVPVALVVVWGVLAAWLAVPVSSAGWRRPVVRTALLLAVGLGVELWSFVPFLLIPNIAYTSNNYVTPANLLATYRGASATWGPYPVLTLTAFSWLVQTPSAYPWIGLFPSIAGAAIVFPLAAVLGARGLRRSPGALLVYAVALSALPFMVGHIAPVTDLNERLLRVGGPFLVLVGGYYFLGPVYVLLVVVALRETLRRGSPAPPEGPTRGRFPSVRRRWRRFVDSASRPSGAVTIGLAVLLVVCAAPFALVDVYQTKGPNADAVAVPPGFETLGDYLGSASQGPEFYTLILPMSAQNGVYVDIGGRQFLDTSNLLASYIPTPILETNNGPQAAAIEDWLAAGPPANIGAVLANLHVRWVVMNPFANSSAPNMNRAAGGGAIDYLAWEDALFRNLGSPTAVGPFSVFHVPGPIPLGWSTPDLAGVDTPTDAGALALIGAVRNGTSPWVRALDASLWAPNGTLPGWSIRPAAVRSTYATLAVPTGYQASLVDRSGNWTPPPCASGQCTRNGTLYAWSGSELTATGPVERSTARPGDFGTTVPPSPSGYCTASGTSLTLRGSGEVSGPALLSANVSLTSPAPDNWASLELDSGNISLVAQAYQNGSTGVANIGLNALYHGVSYVWHNAYLPAPVATGADWVLGLAWNSTTAFATVNDSDGVTGVSLAFGTPNDDATNPGFNPVAAPAGEVSVPRANLTASFSGGGFCLRTASVAQRPEAAFLVATGPAPVTPISVGNESSVTPNGDFVLHPVSAGYAVLGFPDDPLWTYSATGNVPLASVAGAPFANVVRLGANASGESVTFHFRTAILVGLEGSWFEVGGLTVFVAAVTVRRVQRGIPRAEMSPTSTSDAPASAPPRDPPP